MNQGTHVERSRTVNENVERWRDLVARRIRARDERRKPFDFERFLAEIRADYPFYPHAVELADTFEEAVAEAHGSPDRFKKELDGRLGESSNPGCRRIEGHRFLCHAS